MKSIAELIASILPKGEIKKTGNYILYLGINAYEDVAGYLNATKTMTKGNYNWGGFNTTMYWRGIEVILDAHSPDFYSIKLMKTYRQVKND